ncbi:hypothetical protein KW076_01720 [Micrococcus porci]|uniref:hypothetical protein n=1 Tax=Micrococcus porci TaxID=2856555 RepID=UPI001CCB662A|nr:hypothetical protein [Micrococcus porci]UBH24945.1 hypothetical protein KW076_01720 [Micrococcus porci]
METFWGLTTPAWTAIYTLLTAGLLVAAIVAGLYAKRQWETARDAQVEATRPYVLVTLEPGERSMAMVDFVIRNIGVRPAYNVTISIEPHLLRAREEGGNEMAAMRLLHEPTAMIPPGQVTRMFYDRMSDRSGRDDLPVHHTAVVSYVDSSGREWTDTFDLDLRVLEGGMFHSYDDLHTVSQTLKKMARTLDRSRVLKEGEMDVVAVTENRADHQVRTLLEEYHRQVEIANLHRGKPGYVDRVRSFDARAESIAEQLRALGVSVQGAPQD